MKILLGIDNSPRVLETVSLLRRMSWPRGTRVVAVSVIAPSEPQFAPSPAMLAAVAGDLERIETREMVEHEAMIARVVKALRDAGFDAEGRIESGDPRHVLVDVARAEKADLLVVGSHDHTGFRRFAIGSVSSYLATHAPCSVLVVRHDIPELGESAGWVEVAASVGG